MLPPLWAAILSAIVDGARAWSTPAGLLASVGCEPGELEHAINELHANSLIEPWGGRWTLSALSAELLAVELADDGGVVGRERWAPVGRPPRRPSRDDVGPDPVGSLVDPGPGPAELASDRIDAESRPRRPGPADPDRLPRPTVLLAGCASTWSEATQHDPPPPRGRPRPRRRKPAGVCSACKGSPLPRSAYCLRCDRWGWDDVVRSRRPRRAVG